MMWVIALALLLIGGLNTPLAAYALSLAALNRWVTLQPDFVWIDSSWFRTIALVWLVLQLLADLYFVPITVRDRIYINPHRTQNNYLHARVQSLMRPLAAAVMIAALPLPLPDWLAGLFGFSSVTAYYWLTAWIREYVAMMRGALVLLVLETLKNALLLGLALLAFWLPPLALVLLCLLLLPTIVWTSRLQQEHLLYPQYGGQRAGEDSRVVRSD